MTREIFHNLYIMQIILIREQEVIVRFFLLSSHVCIKSTVVVLFSICSFIGVRGHLKQVSVDHMRCFSRIKYIYMAGGYTYS